MLKDKAIAFQQHSRQSVHHHHADHQQQQHDDHSTLEEGGDDDVVRGFTLVYAPLFCLS
jgi:hypothetical protein